MSEIERHEEAVAGEHLTREEYVAQMKPGMKPAAKRPPLPNGQKLLTPDPGEDMATCKHSAISPWGDCARCGAYLPDVAAP